MSYSPEIHHRHTIRMKDYDYAQVGIYFITICVKDRVCLFGFAENNQIHLNEAGEITKQCWLAIPQHFPNVLLHEFIIMPNHVHGIIEIVESNLHSDPTDIILDNDCRNVDNDCCNGEDSVGAKKFSSLRIARSPSRTIGSIVRGFKIGVTKWFGYTVWQRNYYEHIIRSSDEYERIANYIIKNPEE